MSPPALPPVELAVAEHWVEQGRPRLALDLLRELAVEHPDVPRVVRAMGRALAAAGWCREALPWLERARSEGHSGATDAWYEGTCREALGDDAGARVALEEAVRFDPWHVRSWDSLARLGQRTGDLALAEHARDRLWTLPDGEMLAWMGEVSAQVFAGDPEADRALWALSSMRAAPGPWGRHWHMLDGWLALQEGDTVYASQALARAVSAEPADPWAGAWQAEALRRSGDPEAAREVLSRPHLALRDPTPEILAVRAALGEP
jgi:predicted Zn-dependent protease